MPGSYTWTVDEREAAPTASPEEGAPEHAPRVSDAASGHTASADVAPGFLSSQPARIGFESVLVRLIATAGVVGIGTAVGAILVANDVAGWIDGLVVSAVSVILAAVLWRSRRL